MNIEQRISDQNDIFHTICYKNNLYNSQVNAKMYDYKCDVKLRVGNANFKAHKEVRGEREVLVHKFSFISLVVRVLMISAVG